MVRWGVLATGAIAHDFTMAIKLSGGTLQACASRKLESAKAFGDRHGFKKAYGSYEELCDDKEVDVIYIATPHNMHYENILMCASKGKNILCEKPLCPTLWQTYKAIEAAKKADVFLMEGMWTRFFPATEGILSHVNGDNGFGEIVSINTSFGFKYEESFNERLTKPELAGGSVLDIGIYPIHWTLMLLGEPDGIQAAGKLTDTGVDEHMSCLLTWSDKPGVTATITSSFRGTLPNESQIIGTNGMITVPAPFHTPSGFVTKTHTANGDPLMQNVVPQTHTHQMDPPLGNYKAEGYNFVSSQGFVHEIKAVEEALRSGLKEHPLVPHEQTLAAARVVKNILNQIGVRYPFDDPL